MGITKESSIHTAYCEMIRDAKHFIYIENQFFISNARDDPNYTIKNRIAEALVDRVKRAHRRQEKFCVIVLMPLMPAFEGDVNAAGAATLKLVMHWQYQAICRGDHSIAAQLEKEGINMHDYIRFFGLRTYDVIRRFADGVGQPDYAAIAGNAPLEVPGFDLTLKQQGVLPIDRATAAASQVHPPEAPRDVAEHHPSPLTANGPSLSFGGAAPSANDYSFRRPDEAFANDSFPMQENQTRFSQEISRRSQDIPRRLSREHSTKTSSRPNLMGRHSFNLNSRPLPRPRSSFSGLRTFFGEGRSGRRSPRSEGSMSSSDGEAAAVTDNETDEDDGRRRNAFRYLVRGTEHRKQYGGKQAKNGGNVKLHKRLQKYGGFSGDDRRDSDSEFGSSGMQLDMADVENYVHPPKPGVRHHRSPEAAAFLGDQAADGKPVERTLQTVLPELAGAQYMREIAGGDSIAGPSKPAANGSGSGGGGHHARSKSAGSKTAPTRVAATAAYPPPKPRAGPQVLEHEVFGGGAPASRAINGRSISGGQPQQRPPVPAALAAGTPQPREASSDLVHVEREVVEQIVTELVYIHCKLMIVDDRYVIMGSANINDRSMVGNRDSEIAMVVEDTEPVVTTMNGRPYQAAKFAHSLRVQLCQEHCGLLDSVDQMRYVYEAFAGNPPMDTNRSEAEMEASAQAKRVMDDPLSEEFADYWWSTATTNEVAFRDVFRCVPDDTIETFDQYKKFIPGHEVPHGHAIPGRTPKEALERLKCVRGHLVPIPLNFLKNENLGAKLGDKELLVPVEVFT
ncbi:hypothetical protein IWW47_002875 [Coemansia sp. RSA 2052]|nr:hypothetical protein IWW47_002875 [Coemansia sp. RSA 2052]